MHTIQLKVQHSSSYACVDGSVHTLYGFLLTPCEELSIKEYVHLNIVPSDWTQATGLSLVQNGDVVTLEACSLVFEQKTFIHIGYLVKFTNHFQ